MEGKCVLETYAQGGGVGGWLPVENQLHTKNLMLY